MNELKNKVFVYELSISNLFKNISIVYAKTGSKIFRKEAPKKADVHFDDPFRVPLCSDFSTKNDMNQVSGPVTGSSSGPVGL